MSKRKVLFLCTGNSCRSQMAEAIVNARLGNAWEAYSAGIQPAGYVHSMALRALQEIGIEHHGVSKSVEAVRQIAFDVVITVCDSAAENCPLWLGKGARIHIGFADPALVQGSEAEQMNAFRVLRDEITQKITLHLNNPDLW